MEMRRTTQTSVKQLQRKYVAGVQLGSDDSK